VWFILAISRESGIQARRASEWILAVQDGDPLACASSLYYRLAADQFSRKVDDLMQSDPTKHDDGSASVRRSQDSRGKIVFAILGVAAIAALAFAISRIRADSLPTMSRADFEAAQQRWIDSETSNYEIAVKVEGMQPGSYEVAVRNDIATAATFDGRDLKRQRTFGTWSVGGMFDTLSRDLETHDKHGYLLLKAEFDPEFGYPTKYERMEMRTGAHDTLQWEVTKFQKN